MTGHFQKECYCSTGPALHNAPQKNAEDIHLSLNPVGLNSKAWLEFRSKISNHKTSAFCAWPLAGILDALIAGQHSASGPSLHIGSWSLASELSWAHLWQPWPLISCQAFKTARALSAVCSAPDGRRYACVT